MFLVTKQAARTSRTDKILEAPIRKIDSGNYKKNYTIWYNTKWYNL